jgi:hypothetical protein
MPKMNIDLIVESSRTMEAPPQPTLGSAHPAIRTGLNRVLLYRRIWAMVTLIHTHTSISSEQTFVANMPECTV